MAINISPRIIFYTALLFPFYAVSQDHSPVCPPNYQAFEKKCYFFSSESLSFENAVLACKNTGGNLASITNSSENEFIFSQLSAVSWIGYNDIKEEGIFEWVDNSTTAFENWNGPQPDDFQGNEDCATMRLQDGQWNDRRCLAHLPYICKASQLEPPFCMDGTCGSNSPVCDHGKCCYCDDYCLEFGDCCEDYAFVCARQEEIIVGACDGSCGIKSPTGSCWCDEECVELGDCCADACERCGYNCNTMMSDSNNMQDSTVGSENELAEVATMGPTFLR
eukprot:CAMPEP_0117797624 /NCGR_PEP_ID=MMETSP0948-20121206/12643_1 /TAXON_ID=44440 /ORGANISM="Chattonella subsalsa, Strain CCMP2191" /LENGTH=277 /DNA_ID=CAMNT_0005629063 /DNA_START=107 /DNA_END=940 /DNA_ORIENTATION=-